MKRIVFIITSLFIFHIAESQIDESKSGAWYMYFFNAKFGQSRIGIQGDLQYRNWNLGGDLEQLLLRGGLTYQPENTNVLFTLGYGNITSGLMGEETGDTNEHRIYQEALLLQKFGERFFLTHRYRYEQRFLEDQDMRTRYRYALFMNIGLNNTSLTKGTFYLAFYNELFMNGQRNIGDGREVELFDRNRTYMGVGYGLLDNLRIQAGWMNQTTDTWSKPQFQLSLHHAINK